MWNIGQISSIYARDISSNRRIAFVYTVSISFLVLGYRTLSIFHDILYSRILLYIPFLLLLYYPFFFFFFCQTYGLYEVTIHWKGQKMV